MNYGVTGTRTPTVEALEKVEEWVRSLPEDATLYHGACQGVDSYAAQSATMHGLRVVAVVPYNRSKICQDALVSSDEHIYVQQGSSRYNNDYRVRNEMLVSKVEHLTAFWNGEERSGTFMTINIGKRAGIPVDVIQV